MRKYLLCTTAIFTFVELLIVLTHSFLEGYGFHLEYSFSRYIGLEPWSIILFFFTALAILFSLFGFYRIFDRLNHLNLLEKLSALIMSIGLLGLSVCPVGFFDQTWGDYGVVSQLHRIFASIMFTFSTIFVFLLLIRFRRNRHFLLASALFVSYGFVLIVSYALKFAWISRYFLIAESVFLFLFPTLLALFLPVPEEENSAIIKEKKVEE
ncbi:hypothetical protein IJI02_00175 [Candidatus Saccharibacteria bacterium]|nr:hypothetical protein [Candidatus Saccharibacteria bacterium]